MLDILNFVKFQLLSFKNVIVTYYGIVLGIALAFFVFSEGRSEWSGGTLIVFFVIGLNIFRTSFLFAQANNISRRSFYLATLLAILILAIGVGLVDLVLSYLSNSRFLYRSVVDLLYPENLNSVFVGIAILFVAALVGWLTTMLYYRTAAIGKTLLSLFPVFSIWLFTYINGRMGGRLGQELLSLISKFFGLVASPPNPFSASLNLILLSVPIMVINGLLMYRIPVRAR